MSKLNPAHRNVSNLLDEIRRLTAENEALLDRLTALERLRQVILPTYRVQWKTGTGTYWQKCWCGEAYLKANYDHFGFDYDRFIHDGDCRAINEALAACEDGGRKDDAQEVKPIKET